MEPSRKAQLSLALITLAGLAPFLNKQFNIDDPLFLWTAQQIAAHPLDPFGFSVNWTGAPEPMWHAMQNPPLCSCFIANVASVFGWSEVILHAAVLTKYFGITLLPLLAVYTLAHDRRCWAQLLWFCFPIVAVALYDFLSQAQYGHALFVSAANYSREVAAKYKVPLPAQIFTGLAFVGGCIFSVAFFVPIRWCRFLIGAAILLFLALVAAFYFFVPRQSHYQVNNALICAEGAAFAAAGLGILALALIG